MTEFNIPTEQYETILRDRVANLNLEGLQNELNLKVAIAAEEESVIEMAKENLRQIRIAITVLTNELNGTAIDPIQEPITDPEFIEEEPMTEPVQESPIEEEIVIEEETIEEETIEEQPIEEAPIEEVVE